MRHLFTIILLALCCVSCSNLILKEIQTTKRIEFEPLYVRPDIDLSNLRIDIIRQTETETSENVLTGEEETETKDVPYCFMGFDLGNGLFYDLNENLSFRVLDLFGLDGAEYTIRELPDKNTIRKAWDYIYRNDTLYHKKARKDKLWYSHHIKRKDNEIEFYESKRRKRPNYTFVFADSAFLRKKRNRIINEIKMEEQDHKYTKERWLARDFVYEASNDTVNLDNDFRLVYSKKDQSIKIYKGYLKYHVMTIIRSENEILFYDCYNEGYRMVYHHNFIDLYHGKFFEKRYQLIKGK
ncbi:MAG: hypothetical protein ACEPOV_00180 [Hyphomicrobiales bacterium]